MNFFDFLKTIDPIKELLLLVVGGFFLLVRVDANSENLRSNFSKFQQEKAYLCFVKFNLLE